MSKVPPLVEGDKKTALWVVYQGAVLRLLGGGYSSHSELWKMFASSPPISSAVGSCSSFSTS